MDSADGGTKDGDPYYVYAGSTGQHQTQYIARGENTLFGQTDIWLSLKIVWNDGSSLYDYWQVHSHHDIRPGHYLLANGCGLFWERIEYRGNTSGTASLYYGSPSDNNAPNDKVHVQLASVAGLPGLAWDYDFVGSTYSGAFPYEVDKQGNDSTIAKWQHTAKDNDWANYDSIISVQPGWNQREAQNNNCIVRARRNTMAVWLPHARLSR